MSKLKGGYSVTDLICWLSIPYSVLITKLSLPDFIQTAINNISNWLDPRHHNPLDMEIEITRVSGSYGVNEIPGATVGVSVGRRADNINIVAVIHYLAKHLKLFLPASIYCSGEIKSTLGPADPWPKSGNNPKPFKIFEGFIVGSGFVKTDTSVEWQLALTNWLSNLNFSSSTSRTSVVSNPINVSNSNLAPPIFVNGGGEKPNTPGGSSQALALIETAINSPAFLTDVWSGIGGTAIVPGLFNLPVASNDAPFKASIKNYLKAVCYQDRFDFQGVFNNAAISACSPNFTVQEKSNLVKNVEALSALERIEPFNGKYIDGVPLRLKPIAANVADTVKANLMAELHSIFSDPGISSYSIWDRMVTYLNGSLQVAISPQVEKAIVFPYTPGLRKPWVTINANEYNSMERTDSIIRPLRGISLKTRISTQGSAVNGQTLQFGPYYENLKHRNGMIIVKVAPGWLTPIVFPSAVPTEANTNKSPKTTQDTPSELGIITQQLASELWCYYARAAYVQEVLKNRTAKISGRLRFDIAPGSIVAIEDPDEDFVIKQLGTGLSYIYGQVNRVSFNIDSEAQKASTMLEIVGVRNEDENKDDSYSVDANPLWDCKWYGAPLVNEPEFYPNGVPGTNAPEC